jgi:hypothetical protein
VYSKTRMRREEQIVMSVKMYNEPVSCGIPVWLAHLDG